MFNKVPKIKSKDFDKSIKNFVKKRAVPAICVQADISCENWPSWPEMFEPDESIWTDNLLELANKHTLRYLQKQYKKGYWHSSLKCPIWWDEPGKVVQGMPEYVELKFDFTKLENGRPVLEFKLFMKRCQCRKKRIAKMTILL